MEEMIDEQTWIAQSSIIKRFIEIIPSYTKLAHEVASILEHIVNEKEIKYSSITYRPKSLKSFIGKIRRKKYPDPFEQITDFAGVRLVFYYKSDYDKIQKLIQNNFIITQPITDRKSTLDDGHLAYLDRQFIVQLNNKHTGSRHNDIKNMNCEIQIRTIFQDAWAMVDHHLIYKHEEKPSAEIVHEFTNLLGSLGTIENSLNTIKEIRLREINYIQSLKKDPKKLLKAKFSFITFLTYLDWKFEDMWRAQYREQSKDVYNIIQNLGIIRVLNDLNHIIDKNSQYYQSVYIKLKDDESFDSSSVAAIISIGFDYPEVLKASCLTPTWSNVINGVTLNMGNH